MRLRVPRPFGRLITWGHRAHRAFTYASLANVVLLGLVLVTIAAWAYSMRWGIRNDAPVVMYPAHLMRTGQRILYRDIIDMNQPATFLVMGIVDWLCGSNDRLLRAADVIVMALTCAMTPYAFRMPRRLPGWAGSASLALFHLHEAGADALQREVWILFFVVASGAALSRRAPVLSGVLAGLAFFVKFHAIGLAIVLLAGQLYRPTRARTALRWLAGVAMTGAFLIGGLALLGAADDWFWLLRNYLPLYAQLSGQLGFEPDILLGWQERIRFIVDESYAGTTWALPLAAWLTLMIDRRSEWGRAGAMAASFLFVAWLYPIPPGTFWTYHQTPAFFAAGVVLAVLVGARIDATRGTRLDRVIVVCAALWLAQGQMTRWVENAVRNRDVGGGNGAATDLAAYLRTHRAPGETVQPLDTVIGVVDGMWRADAPLATSFTYQFMFFHHPNSPTIQLFRARFLRELDAARPALIVRAAGAGWLCGGVASTPDFDELERLIADHYQVEHTASEFTVYRRRDPW